MESSSYRKAAPLLPAAAELSGGIAGALLRAPVTLFDGLISWQAQADERARLRRLSDHQLQDMGLTRADAEAMARKAVWSRRT